MDVGQFSFLGAIFFLGSAAIFFIFGRVLVVPIAALTFAAMSVVFVALGLLGFQWSIGATFFALGFCVLFGGLDMIFRRDNNASHNE